ncbi:MAG TPA: hypothetical protein VNC62_09900 [Burkholderiales bacterium]|nr:hypothetical protein [Burkholderiales bacterium]
MRIKKLPENHMNNFTPVSALAGGVLIGLHRRPGALVGRGRGVHGGRHGRYLCDAAPFNAEVFVFVGAMIAGGVFARIVFPAGAGA